MATGEAMAKYKVLRAFHVLTMLFAICVFVVLALYTCEYEWFVGVSELIFYKMFGRAAELADNWEKLWPILVPITIGLLIIEELLYNKIYKKAVHYTNRRSNRHRRGPKLLYEDESIDQRAMQKEAEREAKRQRAEEKRLQKEKSKAKVVVEEKPVQQPVTKSQSASAQLNDLLKKFK